MDSTKYKLFRFLKHIHKSVGINSAINPPVDMNVCRSKLSITQFDIREWLTYVLNSSHFLISHINHQRGK